MSKIKKLNDIFKKTNDKHYDVLVATQPNSLYAESFRKIPINLKYVDVDNEPKVIQISSALPGEYKTTTSINLAAAYHELGEKVIIIDCDLRRPKIHRATKVLNDVGLTNYLADQITEKELIKQSEYGFDVITSGESVPYPHVILASDKFKKLVMKLREEYDYIIIDSPPVLLVTDSLVISGSVDATLFVLNQKVARKNEVKEALRLLEEANAKVAGIVLSNVDKRCINYSRYGEYY